MSDHLQEHYALMIDSAVHNCACAIAREGGGYLGKLGRPVWPGTIADKRLLRAIKTLVELADIVASYRAETHQNEHLQAAE